MRDLLTGKFAACKLVPVAGGRGQIGGTCDGVGCTRREISATCGHASCDRSRAGQQQLAVGEKLAVTNAICDEMDGRSKIPCRAKISAVRTRLWTKLFC